MTKLTVLVALALGFSACTCTNSHDREPAPSTTTAEPSDVIDQKLMLALSRAKNAHHKAKVMMSEGDTAGAIAAVREILSLAFPAGAPEAEDVRNDARALLARLLVGQGKLDEAGQVVSEGIASSQRESFFVANLYTVQGEIHEARATTLAAAGDAESKAKATAENHAAIESFDKSIAIDKQLQDVLMEHK